MTQEEKDLLLIDLCARQPYGVKCKAFESIGDLVGVNIEIQASVRLNVPIYEENDDIFSLEFVKPYLRPMSSMTEEEKTEFHNEVNKDVKIAYDEYNRYYSTTRDKYAPLLSEYHKIDWLNKNHFDYRGLIPKGLAIEVTKENNPYKE